MLSFDPNPSTQIAAECEVILRALPDWFGIESAIVDYVRDIAESPTWLWREHGVLLGFLSAKIHFPGSAEIHVMGIQSSAHRKGIGRKLTQACEAKFQSDGFHFLQVKTLSDRSTDPNYAKTREFYLAMGFQPLEVFPTLWDEWNPCLQLVKALS